MTPRGRVLTLALAAAMSAGAHSALAEDFNITVPVSFRNLAPEIGLLQVSCTTMSSNAVIGHGTSETVRISSGGYSGTLVIRFNATAGMDPRAATHYRCQPTLRALKGTPFYVPGPTSPVPNVIIFPTDPKAAIRWRIDDAPLPR